MEVIMISLKSELDLESLLKEIQKLNFWLDDTGTEMAKRQSEGLFTPDAYREICKACNEICNLRGIKPLQVMVNKMKPGVVVPYHRDYLKDTQKQGKYPCLERWHLPIVMNPVCRFLYKGELVINMKIGYWHGPIEYWRYHAVENLGVTERIHLVVDLDSERIGNYEP